MEIVKTKAREVYGKWVTFRRDGVKYKGVIFGLDTVVKEKRGVQKGTEDIYHIKVGDKLFRVKERFINFTDK